MEYNSQLITFMFPRLGYFCITHSCRSTFWTSVVSLFEQRQRELVEKNHTFFRPVLCAHMRIDFSTSNSSSDTAENGIVCVFLRYRFAAGSANTFWSATECLLYMFWYTHAGTRYAVYTFDCVHGKRRTCLRPCITITYSYNDDHDDDNDGSVANLFMLSVGRARTATGGTWAGVL